MANFEEFQRWQAVNAEAKELGYTIEVELATTHPQRWTAYAASLTTGERQPFVAGSERSSLEAAEKTLDWLRETGK
jgi:hypothetical protein